MEDFWTLLLDRFPRHTLARHELAKHYEHRKRDLPAAERLCQEALQFIETRSHLGHATVPLKGQQEFERRLTRIQKKIAGASRRMAG